MHRRLLIRGNNLDLTYISETTIDSNFEPKLHSHPNLEILLITKGKGMIITASKQIKVQERNIVVINPNSKHYEVGEGLSFFSIGITNLNLYLKDTFVKKIILKELNKEEYDTTLFLYNFIFKQALINDSFSESIIKNAYEILFSLFDRKYELNKEKIEQNNDSYLVNNIKAIINSYYANDIKLSDLAHRLSTSKSNLCHEFKKATGITIVEYKINKQLEEALNMIKISDLTISEIASLVGFNNSSYFIKLFKEKYGITPKIAKKLNKNT